MGRVMRLFSDTWDIILPALTLLHIKSKLNPVFPISPPFSNGCHGYSALTKLMEKAPRMVEAQQCNGNTPIFCAGYASSLKATEVLIKKVGICKISFKFHQ